MFAREVSRLSSKGISATPQVSFGLVLLCFWVEVVSLVVATDAQVHEASVHALELASFLFLVRPVSRFGVLKYFNSV